MEGVQPFYRSQQVQLHRFVPRKKQKCDGIHGRSAKGAHRRTRVQVVCRVKKRNGMVRLFYKIVFGYLIKWWG